MRTVTVTQQHISKGQRRSCSGCPVGLAVADLGFKWVLVAEDFIEWWRPDLTGRRYMLPLKAKDFISRFDKGQHVKPFSFRIPE